MKWSKCMEKTLSIIKPDAVDRNLETEIKSKFSSFCKSSKSCLSNLSMYIFVNAPKSLSISFVPR